MDVLIRKKLNIAVLLAHLKTVPTFKECYVKKISFTWKPKKKVVLLFSE